MPLFLHFSSVAFLWFGSPQTFRLLFRLISLRFLGSLFEICYSTSASSGSESSSASAPQNPHTVDEPSSRAGPRPIFMPGTIPCSLTPDELLLISVQYGVPPEYDLELPRPVDRASTPPPGRFYLYQKAFRAGLRLSLPPFVVALFRFLNISLASVTSNFFRFLIGILSLCHVVEVQSSLSLFRYFYTFKRHPSTKDWWYFSPQFGKKRLLKGAPSSIHNWKGKYLFVHCPTLRLGLPPWGSLRDSVRRAPSLGEDDLQAARKLLAYSAPSLPNLLREQFLFNIGLSPQDPASIHLLPYLLFSCFPSPLLLTSSSLSLSFPSVSFFLSSLLFFSFFFFD